MTALGCIGNPEIVSLSDQSVQNCPEPRWVDHSKSDLWRETDALIDVSKRLGRMYQQIQKTVNNASFGKVKIKQN